MIFMPQIFDVTANENARYKRNELESHFTIKATADDVCSSNTNFLNFPNIHNFIIQSHFRSKLIYTSKMYGHDYRLLIHKNSLYSIINVVFTLHKSQMNIILIELAVDMHYL